LLTEKLQAAGTKTQAPRNCRSAMQGISRGVFKKKKKKEGAQGQGIPGTAIICSYRVASVLCLNNK